MIGLQDTNLARVRATEKYLMRCDNILVVANIIRAITDQSLKSSLYKVLARHVPLEWEESGGKGLNVAVVCTRTEVTRSYIRYDIVLILISFRTSISRMPEFSSVAQESEFQRMPWINLIRR